MAEEIVVDELARQLANAGTLHEVLSDAEVRRVLVEEIRDLGVPAPGLAYRLLLFATGRCESFLGAAISSRLQAFIDRQPTLASLIQKILNLQHGAKSADEFKNDLLLELRGEKEFDPEKTRVDEASSLELVMGLHSIAEFKKLSVGMDERSAELLNDFHVELHTLFQDISQPHLDWPREMVDGAELGAFDRLKYTAGIDDFVGREEDLDLLSRFAGDPSMGGEKFNFRWMLLVGDGGAGKTRLAYEFTRKHLDAVWYAGKLEFRQLTGLMDINKWRPSKPTFIVIDYAQAAVDAARDLLISLSRNARHFDVPVRLLLLERNASRHWMDNLVPNDGNRLMIMWHAFGMEGLRGRPLSPIWPDAIAVMMRRRIERAGQRAPGDQELVTAAHSVDPRTITVELKGVDIQTPIPRPLFALAAADALIEKWSAGISDATLELRRHDVLGGIIQRERQQWWAPAATDAKTLRIHEMLLAVTTLAQGLETTSLCEKARLFGDFSRWLPEGPPEHDTDLLSAMGCNDEYLPPLQPDLLGEFYVLQQIVDSKLSQADRTSMLCGVFRLNRLGVQLTILRIFQDFPERAAELALVSAMNGCDDDEVARGLAFLGPDLVNTALQQQDYQLAVAILAAMSAMTDRWRADPELALTEAIASMNFTNFAAFAPLRARIDEQFDRLQAIVERFPDDGAIRLELAMASSNYVTVLSRLQDWQRVDEHLCRLSELQYVHQKDRQIAYEEAIAVKTVTADTDNPKRHDSLLARLAELVSMFPSDRQLALEEAQAVTNVATYAAREGNLERSERLLGHLELLRLEYPDDIEFAVERAKAAANVVRSAGSVGSWTIVAGQLEELSKLRRSFPGNEEVFFARQLRAFMNACAYALNQQSEAAIDALAPFAHALAQELGYEGILQGDDPISSGEGLRRLGLVRDRILDEIEKGQME